MGPLSAYFRYPAEIRKVTDTTNTREAAHRPLRKLTKTKGTLPNENSLYTLLYPGLQNAQEKGTMPIQYGDLTRSQPGIFLQGGSAVLAQPCDHVVAP